MYNNQAQIAMLGEAGSLHHFAQFYRVLHDASSTGLSERKDSLYSQ